MENLDGEERMSKNQISIKPNVAYCFVVQFISNDANKIDLMTENYLQQYTLPSTAGNIGNLKVTRRFHPNALLPVSNLTVLIGYIL